MAKDASNIEQICNPKYIVFNWWMSSKEEILSILEAFASTERMGSFFINNGTPDFLFIRPSGKPIDAKGSQNIWP